MFGCLSRCSSTFLSWLHGLGRRLAREPQRLADEAEIVLQLDARQRQRRRARFGRAFVVIDGRIRLAQLAPALRALGHGLHQRAVIGNHDVVVALLAGARGTLEQILDRSSRTPAGSGRAPSCSEPRPRCRTRRSGTPSRAATASAPRLGRLRLRRGRNRGERHDHRPAHDRHTRVDRLPAHSRAGSISYDRCALLRFRRRIVAIA